MSAPRVVIVGHVEWVTHALGRLPARGHIADQRGAFGEPAGGGGGAAVAAARLGAHTTLVTALGGDAAAQTAAQVLAARGVELTAAARAAAQTPVLTITEPDGERTIMVIGERLQARVDDGLHLTVATGSGAAYYTGEDAALLSEIRARVPLLVVTARRLEDLVTAGVRADVVVGSANDPDEDPRGLPVGLTPAWTVLTDGARGGTVIAHDGTVRRYPAVAPSAPAIDSYGCGDTFAAGLTVGLARGLDIDGAIALGATAGAECATWRGGIGPP